MKKQELKNEINALPEGNGNTSNKIKSTALKYILNETVNQRKTAYELWLSEGNAGSLSDFLSTYQDTQAAEKETSKLGGLVINGSGHLKNNTNFSFATYDPIIVDQGRGSFKLPPVFKSYVSDYLIPINPKKVYKFTASITTNQEGYDNGRRIYLGLAPCDYDGNRMTSDQHMYVGRFNLIKPYVMGVDKFMYVDNVDNIPQLTGSTGHPIYRLRMQVWNDKSANGIQYNYYTRNRINNIIEDGAKAIPIAGGFKIPVKTEGVQYIGALQYGKVLEVGTALSIANSGSNYKYIGFGNETLPLYPEWSRCESYIGGIDYTGNNQINNFPPETAFAKILIIPYGGGSGGENPIQWLSDINLIEVENVLQHRHEAGSLNKKYSKLKKMVINHVNNEISATDNLMRFLRVSEEV